jgi:hypothetical protein
MSQETLPTPSNAPAARPVGIGTLSMFGAAAVIVAAGLSILAAQCPARFRLLGLFSLGWGLLYGRLLSQLARQFEFSVNRSAVPIIGLLAVGGLAGVTWQTFQRDASPVANKFENPLAAAMAAQVLQSPETVPDEVKQAFRSERMESEKPTFREHLSRRVRKLGDWPSPWPEIFWGAELALGASATIAVVLRDHREKSPT